MDNTSDTHSRRVALVHHQARRTLSLSTGFLVAAAAAAVIPHDTGRWLPLHLALAGGVLGAIAAATQLLAVTWSSSPAPPGRVVAVQRALHGVGVLAVVVAREADAPSAVVAAAASVLLGSLGVLAWLLVWIRRRGRTDRFSPAIDGYLLAFGLGAAGVTLGAVLAGWSTPERFAGERAAHVALNVLGLVGVVIAATLPYMVATQGRVRMSPRATPTRLRAATAGLGGATALVAVAWLVDVHALAAAGHGLYALGLVATVAHCPNLGAKQWRWAGARLALLAGGVAWWFVGVALLGFAALDHRAAPSWAVLVVVLGGYLPILAGSLAYLVPVLRGGSTADLTEGFAVTRSWATVAAAHVAPVGALANQPAVIGAGVAVLLADATRMAVVFARRPVAARAGATDGHPDEPDDATGGDDA